jgi:hypothetical protein
VVILQPVRTFRVQRLGAALRFFNVALAFMPAMVGFLSRLMALDERVLWRAAQIAGHPACPELCEGSKAGGSAFPYLKLKTDD